jgi:uncharacterized membrane-anchored protein
MKALRIALAVQVLFFAVWGGYLLTAHRGGKEIWLETQPIDPRDFLSGYYVALAFPIGNPSVPGCPPAPDQADEIYVRLEPGNALSFAGGRPVRLWEAVECYTGPGKPPEGTWAKGEKNPSGWGSRYLYGIERFYVSEGNALRNARSGDVVAKASLNDRHELRIVDLVRTKK